MSIIRGLGIVPSNNYRVGRLENISIVFIVRLYSYSQESFKNYVQYHFPFQEMLKGEVGIKLGALEDLTKVNKGGGAIIRYSRAFVERFGFESIISTSKISLGPKRRAKKLFKLQHIILSLFASLNIVHTSKTIV